MKILSEFCEELLINIFSGTITGIFTILGVIFGGILTFGVLLLVEWYKNKNATENWSRSLFYEVKHNLILKRNLLILLKNHFWGFPDESAIDIYNSNFNIFYSFLRSGFRLKNQKIISLYSIYITSETQGLMLRKIHMKFLYNMNSAQRKTKSTIDTINEMLETEELQLKRIQEVFDLLLKETKGVIV